MGWFSWLPKQFQNFKSLKHVGGAIHLSHSKSSKYLEDTKTNHETTSIISKWDLGKRNNHVGWSLSKSFHYIIPILYTYILVLFRKKNVNVWWNIPAKSFKNLSIQKLIHFLRGISISPKKCAVLCHKRKYLSNPLII